MSINIIPSYVEPSTTLKGGSKANILICSLHYKVSLAFQTAVKLQVSENLLVEEVVNTLIGAHLNLLSDAHALAQALCTCLLYLGEIASDPLHQPQDFFLVRKCTGAAVINPPVLLKCALCSF